TRSKRDWSSDVCSSDLDDIPALHNILASFFVWLLLAGFLVFPGTFTSIQHSLEGKEDSHAWTDQTTEKIFKSVKNIPLLVLAAKIGRASCRDRGPMDEG